MAFLSMADDSPFDKIFGILFGRVILDVFVLESEHSGKCWLVIAFLTGAIDAGGT